jgi:hypothetical protein
MQLIFVTDIGESYTLDVDPNMEMENIMALLEAEVSKPSRHQSSIGPLTLWTYLVWYTSTRAEHHLRWKRTFSAQDVGPGSRLARACHDPLAKESQHCW